MNSDGYITQKDVDMLLDLVTKTDGCITNEQKRRGDVNCNGLVDMGDVVLLQNHIKDSEKYPLNCCE